MNVFVITCTKHTNLLAEFSERFEKYWGGPFFVYVSDTDREHWSNGVIKFLESIKDEYFILLHEDFYLTQPINKELLERLKKLAVELKADRVSLLGNHTPNRTFKLVEPDIFMHRGTAKYQYSYEASIQKREFLLKNLTEDCNPNYAEKLREEHTYGLILSSREPAIWYKDKMRGEKYEEII